MSPLYEPEWVSWEEAELLLVMGYIIVFNRKGTVLREFWFPFSNVVLLIWNTRSLKSSLSRNSEATVMFEDLGSVMRYVSKAKYA